MELHSLFNDKSDLYQQARPSYPAELFKYLASLCQNNCVAWDAACGNGQASIGLANYFDSVLATDVSTAQISNAQARDGIEYRIARSEYSGLANGSVDLVCVAQALHWFELESFWLEVHRVLKPNGVFTAFGYNFPIIDSAMDALLQNQILNIIEPYWAENNRLIWNRYRDINFPFETLPMPSFKLELNWTLDQYFAFIRTFSAARRCIQSQGDDFLKQAHKNAHDIWNNPMKPKTVAFDFVLYVGRLTQSNRIK